ncbi:MAG: hypothetical protein U0326_31155 [Polyangiales bacterium]
MGEWGTQFVRFAPAVRSAATEAADVATELRATASRLGAAQGGVIFIPRPSQRRGAWLLGLASDIEIPERVELMFAPGAALLPVTTPAARGELKIAGLLTAERGPIFGTRASARRMRPDVAFDAYEIGRVRFTGGAVERVYPEWWGAGMGDAEADTGALQAAFDAAHRDRFRERWLRPLVVELTGSYGLTAPLVVGDARGGAAGNNPGTFELQGVPGAASTPTLRWRGDFTSEAMVVIDHLDEVRIDEVRFDAGANAAVCLSIKLPDEAVGSVGGVGAHHLRNCHFRGATDHLLSVEHGMEETSLPRRKTVGVVVEGGVFSPEQTARGGYPRAVRLRTSPEASVGFRGVSFVGSATTMLHITGTAASFTNCYFRNDLAPPGVSDDVTSATLHTRGPEGGIDLFLDASSGETPASVAVMHCVSHSVQFLVTRGNTVQIEGRDSTITGLRHAVRSAGISDRALRVELPPLLFRPREPDVFEMTPIITQSKGQKVAPDPAPNAAPTVGIVKLDAPIAATTTPTGNATPNLTGLLKTVDPKVLNATQIEPPTLKQPTIAGRWIALDGAPYQAPLPPIIDWDGRAQGGGGLVLCACRFDRPVRVGVPAVVGRRVTRPIFDLGVRWGDPANGDGLIMVVGATDETGISRTAAVPRAVPDSG